MLGYANLAKAWRKAKIGSIDPILGMIARVRRASQKKQTGWGQCSPAQAAAEEASRAAGREQANARISVVRWLTLEVRLMSLEMVLMTLGVSLGQAIEDASVVRPMRGRRRWIGGVHPVALALAWAAEQ